VAQRERDLRVSRVVLAYAVCDSTGVRLSCLRRLRDGCLCCHVTEERFEDDAGKLVADAHPATVVTGERANTVVGDVEDVGSGVGNLSREGPAPRVGGVRDHSEAALPAACVEMELEVDSAARVSCRVPALAVLHRMLG
jgi:hypothetical protein